MACPIPDGDKIMRDTRIDGLTIGCLEATIASLLTMDRRNLCNILERQGAKLHRMAGGRGSLQSLRSLTLHDAGAKAQSDQLVHACRHMRSDSPAHRGRHLRNVAAR
jgi:hypothetical protein